MAHTSALLSVMIKAARLAAKSLRRDYFESDALTISRKGASDFVSQADLRAEEIIREALATARPKYGMLLEEGGEIEGSDKSNRWIVDPLDGTTNFLHGIPVFAISIGLERDRAPYAGVIYNPITDEMFYAEKGQGAYLNEKRIRVSRRDDMNEALLATGLPYQGRGSDGDRELALAETGRVLAASAGVRRFGSAAIDLAMVAQGRIDGFWERGLSPWDVTAGCVLVREAGGMVSEIAELGRPHLANSILASNGELHEQARKLILGK